MAKKNIDEKALFRAALEEFSSRSYNDASVNTIISNAGISKGSFYYRFEDKYSLYIHVLKESSRVKWEYIRSQTAAAARREEGLFDIFISQAEAGARFAADHPEFHRLGRMFTREKGTEHYEKAMTDLGLSEESGLDATISRAVARESFSSDYSDDFIRRLIRSVIFRFDEIFFPGEDPDPETAVEYLRQFVALLKKGL